MEVRAERVSGLQRAARTIYIAAAKSHGIKSIMQLHTFKDKTFVSDLLNRAMGVQDTLARIEPFYKGDTAFQTARNYLDYSKNLFRKLWGRTSFELLVSAAVNASMRAYFRNMGPNGFANEVPSHFQLIPAARAILKEAGYSI